MNVGVFLASLKPTSAAEQRFQGSIFNALTTFSPPNFRFFVITGEMPDEPPPSNDRISYVMLRESRSQIARTLGLWQRLGSRYLRSLVNLLGGNGTRLEKTLARAMQPEPVYYEQLRELNLRIIWNLSQAVLPAPMPFIRVMWDVNHRIHSMYPEYSYSRYGFDALDSDFPHSLARASYVLVGTEEGKRQLVDMYNVWHGKVRVVPFPTPELPQPEAVESPVPAGDPYIFYPARFWPHKNHVVIAHALKILSERHGIRLRAVFSGVDEGNLDYVMRSAQALGVRDQLHYVGLVSEAELRALYSGAFALVYASAVGPDNLPPLEAMAIGCPVVTAEVPGAHEQYGEAALFFPPTDEEALASHLKALYENDQLRRKMIKRGHARAESWTPEDYVKSVVGILEEFSAIGRAWERCDSQFT